MTPGKVTMANASTVKGRPQSQLWWAVINIELAIIDSVQFEHPQLFSSYLAKGSSDRKQNGTHKKSHFMHPLDTLMFIKCQSNFKAEVSLIF